MASRFSLAINFNFVQFIKKRANSFASLLVIITIACDQTVTAENLYLSSTHCLTNARCCSKSSEHL